MHSRKRPKATQRLTIVGFAAAIWSTVAFIPSAAMATPLPNCAGLAAQLLKNSDILSATSAVQPATASDLSYCMVNITVSDLAGVKDGYLPHQKQMIEITIGLPLNSADGGSGAVQGNWNGRIEDLGGGGYQGTVTLLPLTTATDFGFVGSSTDTGHESSLQGVLASADGSFALNPNDTLNWGLIRDFAFNGIHDQAVWTKKLTQIYYGGTSPKYTYWVGGSTGGRQAIQQALKYPDDFDGIVAGCPAVNFDRLSPAQLWAAVVMNQEVGAPITSQKLDNATSAAIAACDGLDGIMDGVLQDPRACLYDANALVCGQPGAPTDPAICLQPNEAGAINKIWNGPPGPKAGQQLWFGYERGTPVDSVGGAAGTVANAIATQWFQYWVFKDPAFDWHTLTEKTFDQAFRRSELMFHDVIGTDDPDLSAFKRHGGKLVQLHGLADPTIPPRGTYNYYNRVTELQGSLSEVQKFYRFFPYPGNNHCAGNLTQPNAPLINLFDPSSGAFQALINWVEHGVAPDSIIAWNGPTEATSTVVRPICKYPDTLKYNGTGSTSVASSFTCQHQTGDELMNAEQALPDPGRGPGNGD
jgi:hypothetical protein